MDRNLRSILPALNVHERIGLLGGIKAAAPPVTFQRFVTVAEAVLSTDEYQAIAQAIGIPRRDEMQTR
jgi:hypothetical protein